MKNSLKKDFERRIKFLKENINKLTIDTDTHLTDMENLNEAIADRVKGTPDYYHGKPIGHKELLAEMKQANVDMCLVWQNPAATIYSQDKKKNFERLLAANRYIYDTVNTYPEKFIPAGWTDPRNLAMEDALKMVEICVTEFGFPVVKMNPAQNAYPMNSSEVKLVQDKIVGLGAVPAFHYGADTPFTPASGLAEIAVRYPEHPVLAIHMGGGGAGYMEAENLYHESRRLGLKHPNIKFVLSARRDTHSESDLITYQLAGEPFSKNIFCASDAPYGKLSWNFGGYRLMLNGLKDGKNHTDPRIIANPELFNDQAVQNYLGRNFAELMIETYQRLLQTL
jgi:predicted TIM-barrel fold metal-dependent hydrolase